MFCFMRIENNACSAEQSAFGSVSGTVNLAGLRCFSGFKWAYFPTVPSYQFVSNWYGTHRTGCVSARRMAVCPLRGLVVGVKNVIDGYGGSGRYDTFLPGQYSDLF
jgi:hypothetical protein